STPEPAPECRLELVPLRAEARDEVLLVELGEEPDNLVDREWMDEAARLRPDVTVAGPSHLGGGRSGIGHVARPVIPLARLLADVDERVVEVVVRVPVHGSGEPADPSEGPAGPEGAGNLAERPEPVRDELQHERRDGDVDGSVGQIELVGERNLQVETRPIPTAEPAIGHP